MSGIGFPLTVPKLYDLDSTLEERLSAQTRVIDHRNRAAKELDTILAQIRQNPEFTNFLKPSTEETFREAANFLFFLKLITYMWSHRGDMVRQRQSVWIQGSRAVNCLSHAGKQQV